MGKIGIRRASKKQV